MESAKLATRLHEILKDRLGTASPVERPAPGRRLASIETAGALLGASRWKIDAADCLVVEREYPADLRHGVMPIGEYAEAAARAIGGLDLLGGAAGHLLAGSGSAHEVLGRQLFFDLETTGLAGGAGTYAFLVGFGYFQGTTFQTRQFFLADYADERYLLRAVSEFVEPALGLVTFNGRTFDLPLIAIRYSMQRLRSPFEDLPHVDMLHPARRLWRRRRQAGGDRPGWSDPAGTGGGEYASCALGALERAILDVARVGDVPGAEIPARYFDYIRHGDATPLVDVFEHNRLDLVSLAALTSIVLTMIEGGAEATHNPRECVALGRLFEQTGQAERAKACYVRTAHLVEAAREAVAEDDVARGEALRWLALRLRRERRYDEAAVLWHQVLEISVSPPDLQREAIEALAIHHEHRSRDLDAALAYALRGFERDADDRFRQELERRLARLRRKMSAS
jgi:uncharacterized protein